MPTGLSASVLTIEKGPISKKVEPSPLRAVVDLSTSNVTAIDGRDPFSLHKRPTI